MKPSQRGLPQKLFISPSSSTLLILAYCLSYKIKLRSPWTRSIKELWLRTKQKDARALLMVNRALLSSTALGTVANDLHASFIAQVVFTLIVINLFILLFSCSLYCLAVIIVRRATKNIFFIVCPRVAEQWRRYN